MLRLLFKLFTTPETDCSPIGVLIIQKRITIYGAITHLNRVIKEMNCNVCKGPYHPATGHYVSRTMVVCGVCTRKWVKWLSSHSKRTWGGLKFYDHAKVPAMMCDCKFCLEALKPFPLGNNGKYEISPKGPNDDSYVLPEDNWVVVGFRPPYKHVKVVWGFKTEAEALTFTKDAANGIFPKFDE